MRVSKRLATILTAAMLLGLSATALQARGRKGDKLYAQGRQAEQSSEYDKALDFYSQALAADATDTAYQMSYRRVRFQAGQKHVDNAQSLRDQGKLDEAAAEFGKAVSIDPASPVARQELQRTMEMIDRAKKQNLTPEERILTPAAAARREADRKLAAVLSVPELKPLSALPQTLKINNQTPKVMFETISKLAGINVLFDPDFTTGQATLKPLSLELTNTTLEEALDYVAMMTRAFWKPITANAIFVTQDNQNKRNEYEEQVARVFYINNAGTQQDLTEILNGVRLTMNTLRISAVLSQNAVIVRGTADQVALAEMLIRNLDRPKAEVVVDVIVMEVNRSKSRDLGASLLSGTTNGLTIPIGFTPRSGVTQPGSTTGTTTSSAITLGQLAHVSSNDFSLTLPGATLEALMTDSNARILQSPQVRAIDNMKASLKIGDRVPYSTGGFQPMFGQATGGAGASSLYSSFQYLDVGVNVDITPKVHGPDEVSLHIELDISNVKERIDIAGISQPVVGQRKVIHDIRLREGEINLLGGLVDQEETKSVSGLPVLGKIPWLGRLFSTESIKTSDNELMIALVPHIVRTPDLDSLSYKGIASGNMNTIRLNYTPAAATPPPAAAPAAPAVLLQAPAAPPAAKPAPAARVLLSPEKVEAASGGSFTLNVQVENASDLFAAPLRLKFDPNVLRLTDVTRGDFLATDGREILFTRNILNDTGDVNVNLSRMPGFMGMSGSGSLATLSFQVIGKGVTTVTAPQLRLQDSRGQNILTASPQATVTVK